MQISVFTKKDKQVIDITGQIEKQLSDDGVCIIHAMHTTVGITTADLDPGTDLDMLDAFTHMIPKLDYRHPHDPSHVPDHILSSLIGTNLSLPFENGKLLLGTWQRVVLVEFNGPKKRNVHLSFIK